MNDAEGVASATREQVMAAARELSYRPSRAAKSLAQRSPRTVTVAVPTFTTPFHNELLKGVRDQLEDIEVDLLLCDLDRDNPEHTLRDFLSRGMIDGLLVVGVTIKGSLADELDRTERPVVLVGGDRSTVDSFYWNDEHGAKQATKHLLEHCHAPVGMITAPSSGRVEARRIRGYRSAIESNDQSFSSSLVVETCSSTHNGHSEEAGYEAMQELLRVNPSVSGIFASSDVQAMGAWRALRDSGRQVPEDCALVGYDDIKTSQYVGLSSVSQGMKSVGYDATDLLLRRMNGWGGAPASTRVRPQLQVRRSSSVAG